ncbi:alpha/beta hydrolase [Bacillus cereus]|nr:alpha/beta hydrolase [Bacillus cereus]
MFMKDNIVFLHGITGDRNAFKTEYEYLKSSYDCWWYDFPGYGLDTLGKDVPFSLEILVEQLNNEYERAGIEVAHLCALSFGCLLALAFANKYPEKVASLTFSGGYCNVPSEFQANLSQLLTRKSEYTNQSWLKQYAMLQNPNRKEIPEDSQSIFYKYGQLLHPSVFEKAVRIQMEFDSEEMLMSIKQPVLWVMGEHDHLYKETLYNINYWIPHVTYIELKNAGHVAHIHEPKQFMDVFESFLKETECRSPKVMEELVI